MSQSYVSAMLERLVTERTRKQCKYCRCLMGFNSDPFAMEHILPEIKGGLTNETNLALSCLGCNGIKGAAQHGIDPVTEQSVPLFHPRQQNWSDHFVWNEDTTQIIGITGIGRALEVSIEPSYALECLRLASRRIQILEETND